MERSLSVVVAPDSFKGSLPARAVAEAISAGWTQLRPDDRMTLLPQADGGEGTLAAIAAALPDSRFRDAGPITGPDGRQSPGAWLELPGRVAVAELALCSGLTMMETLDPLGATTRGLGEVIRNILNAGMTSLLIGLGGSASTDGGSGALAALGMELLDTHGGQLADGGAALSALASIRRANFCTAPTGGVTLLTDVSAPLLGPSGAAAVFGPQKGANSNEVHRLDAALAQFASVLGGDPGRPGAGAAGGTGYGLATAWNATITSGARYICELSGLTAAIQGADVVLTGEGRFDATSSTGKVVGELMTLARQHDTPVGIVAGQIMDDTETWAVALANLAGSAERAIASPIPALEEAGRRAARHFAGTAP